MLKLTNGLKDVMHRSLDIWARVPTPIHKNIAEETISYRVAPVEILVTLREKTGSVEISTLYCVDSGGSEGLETGTGTSQRLAVASENCSKYKKEIFT